MANPIKINGIAEAQAMRLHLFSLRLEDVRTLFLFIIGVMVAIRTGECNRFARFMFARIGALCVNLPVMSLLSDVASTCMWRGVAGLPSFLIGKMSSSVAACGRS